MTVWLLVYLMSGNTLASNEVFRNQTACETYRINHNFPAQVRCVGFVGRAST
jgi:hypothetical protein